MSESRNVYLWLFMNKSFCIVIMCEMYLIHIPKQVSLKQCFLDHSSQMKHTLLNHCEDEAWIRYGNRELSFVHG